MFELQLWHYAIGWFIGMLSGWFGVTFLFEWKDKKKTIKSLLRHEEFKKKILAEEQQVRKINLPIFSKSGSMMSSNGSTFAEETKSELQNSKIENWQTLLCKTEAESRRQANLDERSEMLRKKAKALAKINQEKNDNS